jgi:parallel beta-helix repeat protein
VIAASSCLFAAVASLAYQSPARGATAVLYVGQSGCSDGGPGTDPGAPFCTIRAALAVATAGSTVSVAGGTYAADVTFPRSGTPAARITLAGTPGATVLAGGTNGVKISSGSYITVTGITTTGSTGVQGATSQGIYLNKVTASVVRDNLTDHNSDAGIYLTNGSTGVTVSGNESAWNAFGYIRNAPGIDLRSAGNTVVRNVVHDNEDTGIQLYSGGSDNLVADNLSYHNKGFTSTVLTNCNHPKTGDTAGCITGDHGIDDFNVSGNRIIGNTVSDNVAAGINVEASDPSRSGGFTVENNISVDNAVNCPNGAGGTEGCPRTSGNIRIDGSSGAGTTVDANLVNLSVKGYEYTWGKTPYATLAAFQAASGQEPHGIQADPRWVAPASANFRLTAASSAIDSADSAAPGEQATDLLGNPRVDVAAVANGPSGYDDRGAFEYQDGSAPPPPPPSTVPGAPALSATAGNSGINLAWTTPTDGGSAITDYLIYRGSSPSNESSTPLVDVPAGTNSYQDTSAPTGSASYYAVTAVNNVGESVRSNEVSATPAAPPPPPPGGLVANPSFETNLTGWAAGSGVSLTRTTITVHSGTAAALLTLNTAGNDALLNDSPDWNRNTTAGTTCTATAWILGPANPEGAFTAKIRFREYAAGANVASVTNTATLPSGSGWIQLSVSIPVAGAGHSLDLNVYGKGLASGQTLVVDDVAETCQ